MNSEITRSKLHLYTLKLKNDNHLLKNLRYKELLSVLKKKVCIITGHSLNGVKSI